MIVVSVCLPSDALSQHLPSYLGFSYLGHGVSIHGCSSKAQPLLLTLDEGYLLRATPHDLERGVAPLGPPAPGQPPLLGWGLLFSAAPADLGSVVTPLCGRPDLGCGVNSSLPLLHRHSLAFFVTTPIMGEGYLLSATLSAPVAATRA